MMDGKLGFDLICTESALILIPTLCQKTAELEN